MAAYTKPSFTCPRMGRRLSTFASGALCDVDVFPNRAPTQIYKKGQHVVFRVFLSSRQNVADATFGRISDQCAVSTGNSACVRIWRVVPPKINCRSRLCV